MGYCVRPTMIFLFLVSLLAAGAATADQARLAQFVDYVGVDYPAAVQDGEVVSELEYAEMREFAVLIEEEVDLLPAGPAQETLLPLTKALEQAIAARAEAAKVAAIAHQMSEILLSSATVAAAPAQVPDLGTARRLYAEHCAGCHGDAGAGNGPAAAGLEPPPTDFTDAARARERSLYGLYNTITLGVDGTGMPGFPQLSAQERWALAFYVGGLHVSGAALTQGQRVYEERQPRRLPSLREITTSRPADIAERQGDAEANLHGWLRRNAKALADARPDPLNVAMRGIRRSVAAYAQGETAEAHDAAVDAYLEGFELAEAALAATQPDLVLEVENAMTALRSAIRQGSPVSEVQIAGEQALVLLEQAQASRTEESLSAGVAFASSLVILLREGLEAILVIAAMAAFLGQTGRRDALSWLYGGWIAALAAGGLTWAVSNYFIEISGATREITEGVAALAAAAVLFYVGFWMHSKLNARRWQEFIQHSIRSALNRRSLWALAGIAFVAAYREVFETVLFLQALWAQSTDPDASRAVVAGFVSGSVLIVVLAWAIFRFGLRLPLRQFFGVSAVIMIALAVIFAGKGVAALQEAGKLPLDPIAFPRIELLGVYPTLQSLGAQLLVLGAALTLALCARRPRTSV